MKTKGYYFKDPSDHVKKYLNKIWMKLREQATWQIWRQSFQTEGIAGTKPQRSEWLNGQESGRRWNGKGSRAQSRVAWQIPGLWAFLDSSEQSRHMLLKFLNESLRVLWEEQAL